MNETYQKVAADTVSERATIAGNKIPVNGSTLKKGVPLLAGPIFRVFMLLLSALTVCACSPRYNWRDVQGIEGVSATFPGKVQKATRRVDLDGIPVSMTMTGARVEQLTFVVGLADLPSAEGDVSARALEAVQKALLLNIAATDAKTSLAVIPRRDPAAAAVAARVIDATGHVNGEPVFISVRLAVQGKHLYEFMVSGPASSHNDPDKREALETFFSSLRLN